MYCSTSIILSTFHQISVIIINIIISVIFSLPPSLSMFSVLLSYLHHITYLIINFLLYLFNFVVVLHYSRIANFIFIHSFRCEYRVPSPGIGLFLMVLVLTDTTIIRIIPVYNN